MIPIYCRLLTVTLITSVCACSNQQVYQAIQENRQQECEKLVATQREDCLRQYDEPYEDYQRSREELLEQ